MSEATMALGPEARLGDPQGKEPWACPWVVFCSPMKHLSPVVWSLSQLLVFMVEGRPTDLLKPLSVLGLGMLSILLPETEATSP